MYIRKPIPIELNWLRLKERTARSRLLWTIVRRAAQLVEKMGMRKLTAMLAQRGQRSCPYADLRSVFGALAYQCLPEIIATGSHTDTLRPFDPKQRILVLKPFLGAQERGVLYVKFSEVISALPRAADLRQLSRYFSLVVEPSWTGLCDPGILQYLKYDFRTIVLAPDRPDFEFLQGLGGSLVPIDLGPCDWVDPRVAEPYLNLPKTFDIVVNSNWAPLKRHHIFFKALQGLPPSTRVALIGGPMNGGDIRRLLRIAKFFGVHEQLSVFEHIPYSEVMRIVCSSRCSALFSLKEGANRALAESMFCNVPVLLLEEHVGGIRKNIVSETGVMVDERNVRQGLEALLSVAHRMTPRAWAESNISCVVSTARLNSLLRQLAEHRGEKWSTDIVVKTNSPEMKYLSDYDDSRLRPHTDAVRNFISGSADSPVSSPVK